MYLCRRIWTGEEFVSGIVVDNATGKIIKVGLDGYDDTADVVELPGCMVMPGIADRHTHWLFELVGGSQSLARTTVFHDDAARDFRILLKLRLASQQSGTVIFTDWSDAAIPLAQVREIVRTESRKRLGREVLVLNRSWHNAVASDALLARVMPSISAMIQPYRLQGTCRNNIIDEDLLIQLIARLELNKDVLRVALRNRQQLMLSRGITRCFDKMILGFPLLEMLYELSMSGDLVIPTDGAIQPWMMMEGAQPRQYGPNLRVRWLKYFADGAFGNRKARMCTQQGLTYSDGSEGILMLPDTAQMQRDINRWREMGGDGACVHAIGPGAVMATHQAFTQILDGGLGAGFTLGFEHFEACPITEVHHVAELQRRGVRIEVCSQPGFNDDLASYADRLPPAVLAMVNRYADFDLLGLHWSFGTDGPITGDRTFAAFAQAVSRLDGEAIRVERMLQAAIDRVLTVGAPFTAISIDRDVLADPSGLADTQVLETWIGGRKVWQREGSASES